MSDTFNIVNRVKGVKTFKGVDNQGFESIVFILKKKPEFELKTTKIASRVLERTNEYRLFISLLDDNETSAEIFDILIEDLIQSIENIMNEQEVLEILAIRFQYWSELFRRKYEQMDEKWIQGFCGELWFLDNVLIDKIGCEEAIKSWVGPEKANQDFITSQMVFEIKTKTQQANSIKISNDNQLSKNMYLSVIEINKSSEVAIDSFNLYKLITSIYTKIKNPKIHIEFNLKLLELELFPLDNARIYDKYAYEFVSLTHYKVDSEFPFIDHRNIPNAIIQYSYELSLNSIECFKKSEEEIWN